MALILGIDPGSVKTGYGFVNTVGKKLEYVDAGTIRTGGGPVPERLKVIHDSLTDLIQKFQPQVVSIEEVFLARDPSAAIKLGQARGAAIVAATQFNMDVFEYTAKQIKLAVVGKGNADKAQVQHMVRILLGLRANPAEDAADGLAAAICHVNTHQTLLKMSESGRVKAGRIK